jgi:hypothetical protein
MSGHRTLLNAFAVFSAVLLLAAVTAAAGCGDGGGSNNNNQHNHNYNTNQNTNNNQNNAAGLTVEQYCQAKAELEQAWCDYLDQCCTAADKAAIEYNPPRCRYGPDNPADCVQWANNLISAGSMVYNGASAQAFLDAKAQWIPDPPTTCSGTMGSTYMLQYRDRPADIQIPACRQTFVGQLQSGADCNYGVECADGLRCQDVLGNFQCAPVVGSMGRCDLITNCDDGLRCIGQPDAEVCRTLLSQGASCFMSSDCQDGLMCYNDTCNLPIAQGGNCSGSMFGCEPLTGCDTGGSNLCVRLKNDGASCSFSYECLGRCDTSASQCVSICGGTH